MFFTEAISLIKKTHCAALKTGTRLNQLTESRPKKFPDARERGCPVC